MYLVRYAYGKADGFLGGLGLGSDFGYVLQLNRYIIQFMMEGVGEMIGLRRTVIG
jgi:hypothetical protein